MTGVCLHVSHTGTVVLCDIRVSACVCTCGSWQRCFGLLFPVWFVLSCLFLSLFFFLMLRKDCERTERELNRKKREPLLLMAGPDVNRKLKVWKETSLRLRWSNSSYCNDAFALIFLFPTTLEELINILSLKITWMKLFVSVAFYIWTVINHCKPI